MPKIGKGDIVNTTLQVPECWRSMIREVARRESLTQKDLIMNCVGNYCWNRYKLRMTDFKSDDPLRKSVEREVARQYKNQITTQQAKIHQLERQVKQARATVQQRNNEYQREMIKAFKGVK